MKGVPGPSLDLQRFSEVASGSDHRLLCSSHQIVSQGNVVIAYDGIIKRYHHIRLQCSSYLRSL